MDRVLEAHALPWRAAGDRIEWIGDRPLHETTIAPALRALDDPRLADARAAYEEALVRRRRGDPKSLEAAIHEAGKAVEASLKAVLAAHGVPPPKAQQAASLWGSAVKAGLVAGMWEHTVLAASGPRNQLAGHPPAPGVPCATSADADAAVGAAGVALGVIARALN